MKDKQTKKSLQEQESKQNISIKKLGKKQMTEGTKNELGNSILKTVSQFSYFELG